MKGVETMVKTTTNISSSEEGSSCAIKAAQPNQETIAAMLEAERIAWDTSVKGYDDLDELFSDLKK